MRLLFSAAGYVCVATVLTAVFGYGYLRHSGTLDDEKIFRIMAIVHDVDLAEIEARGAAAQEEVPPEELSYAEQQRHYQTAVLQFDAKQKELADSLEAFEFRFSQLNTATERYNQLSDKVQTYLNEQKQKVLDKALQEVREQLRMLIPKKQAKPILIKMIQNGDLDEVIQLLSSLPPRSQQAILKTFDTEQDVELLFQLTQRMLAGDPARAFIDEQLETLQELKSQDQ